MGAGQQVDVYTGDHHILTKMTYDQMGNMTSLNEQVSGATRRSSTFVYDPLSRLTRVNNPDGTYRLYTYPTSTSLYANVTDENGKTTWFEYDEQGRVQEVTYPDNASVSYQYDANGNLWKRTDSKGTTTYGYDEVDRLGSISYPNGTPGVVYSYYHNGLVNTEETVGITTTLYNYDSADRLTAVDYNHPYDTPVVTYNYHDEIKNDPSIGGKLEVGLTRVWAGSYTYAYDKAGRLTDAADPLGQNTTWLYDDLGRATSQNNGNGTSTTYEWWNTRDFLWRVRHWNLSQNPEPRWTQFATGSDQFDGVGNRKEVLLGNLDTITYEYDNLYRLTKEHYQLWDAGSPSYKDLRVDEYRYDKVGNRQPVGLPGKSQTNYYPPGVPSTKNESYYAHDDNNKMQTETVNKYVWSGGAWAPYDTDLTAFEYDGNGNMTRQTLDGQSVTSFGYDAENRLSSITFPNLTTNSFSYYGDGLRRSRVDSGGTRNYYYDGDDIIAESDGAGHWPSRYFHGALGLVTIVTSAAPGEYYPWWHHGDFIGTTRVLSGVAGTVHETYDYDAYGIPLNDQTYALTPFRHVGRLGYYNDREGRVTATGTRRTSRRGSVAPTHPGRRGAGC
jgi:YD repeat-containing protein